MITTIHRNEELVINIRPFICSTLLLPSLAGAAVHTLERGAYTDHASSFVFYQPKTDRCGRFFGGVDMGFSHNRIKQIEGVNALTTPLVLTNTQVHSTNLSVGGVVGYYFKRWPIKTELEYLQNGNMHYNASPLLVSGNTTMRATITTHTFFWNAYLDPWQFMDRFIPYIGGGLGISYTHTRSNLTGLSTANGDTGALALQAAAGLLVTLGPHWDCDLSYRYQNFGRMRFGTLTAPGSIIHIKSNSYDSHTAMLRIDYTI